MEMSVKWHGFEAIIKTLREIKKETLRKLEEAFKAGAMDFAREAKKRVPVDKNILRPSIRWAVEKTPTGFRGAVGTNVQHAIYTEFGTKRIKVGTPEHPRTSWPAKQATRGKPSAAVQRALARRAARGGGDEMMPWLRPAWLAVQHDVIKRIRKVL